MEYSKLISVTGLGGLFELVASKADGAIVRSLEDKSTKFISSRQHSFSHLESIEVYTQRENVNLVEVLRAMEASSEPLPSEKDAAAIKKYFQKIYPDMDFDRVYASDMKKMVKWLALLKKNEIELKLREEEEEVKSDEDKAMEEEDADIEPATTEAVADEQTATAKEENKTTRKKKTAKKRGES
jgi:RecA-family ATPase